MEKRIKIKGDEGVVSLVICILLIILVTLITLSFAAISRREQRQALDAQLSTQAFYAAESGINSAIKAVESGEISENIDDCSSDAQADINPVLDLGAGVETTCILVDLTPSELEADISTDDYKIFRISASGLSRLQISWQHTSASTDFRAWTPSGGLFPPVSQWGAGTPGVVSVQLIPVAATRSAVQSGSRQIYAYPTGDSSVSSSSDSGDVLTGGCNAASTPRHCSIELTGLSGQYHVRLRAVYNPVSVTLKAFNSSGDELGFVGGQVMVDATGRAADVVRRVKIYKSLASRPNIPSYALEVADDLCKRLRTDPSLTDTDVAGIPSCNPTGL